jgi:hypothetical protein
LNKIRGQNKKIKAPRTSQRIKQRNKKKNKKKEGRKRKKKKRESNNNLPRFSSCLRIFQGLQDQDPYSFFQPCAIG